MGTTIEQEIGKWGAAKDTGGLIDYSEWYDTTEEPYGSSLIRFGLWKIAHKGVTKVKASVSIFPKKVDDLPDAFHLKVTGNVTLLSRDNKHESKTGSFLIDASKAISHATYYTNEDIELIRVEDVYKTGRAYLQDDKLKVRLDAKVERISK